MNLDFWKNKNVLITGHTGFKGSWLTLLLHELGSNIYGISDKKKEGIYEIVELSDILKKEFFVDINIPSPSPSNNNAPKSTLVESCNF